MKECAPIFTPPDLPEGDDDDLLNAVPVDANNNAEDEADNEADDDEDYGVDENDDNVSIISEDDGVIDDLDDDNTVDNGLSTISDESTEATNEFDFAGWQNNN